MRIRGWRRRRRSIRLLAYSPGIGTEVKDLEVKDLVVEPGDRVEFEVEWSYRPDGHGPRVSTSLPVHLRVERP